MNREFLKKIYYIACDIKLKYYICIANDIITSDKNIKEYESTVL